MSVKILTRYQCSICSTIYDERKAAQECSNQGMDKRIAEVGDIVRVQSGFVWYDGDKRWIINPQVKLQGIKSHGNCFSSCCTYEFYYVITMIDKDPSDLHRWRYHVMTKAMSGKQGHVGGFTFARNHHTPEKIKKVPKFIIEDSRDLIGIKTQFLL